MELTQKPNRELYKERMEPPYLKDKATGKYIHLRTTNDIDVLRKLVDELHQSSKEGIEYVITSWTSPPFGIVAGYGVYTRKEAEQLSEISQKERWGFPRFGLIYNVSLLEEKIKELNTESSSALNPVYEH